MTTATHASRSASWVELGELLDPIRQGAHSFHGAPSSRVWGAPYGGLLVAQSLAAATATVPAGMSVRSLHAYFVKAGAGDQPVDIDVHTVRDGGSSAWRTVEVVQSEFLLLRLEAMFSRDSTGPSRQAPMPDAPDPEALPNIGTLLDGYDDTFRPWDRNSPFDLRCVTPPPRLQGPAPGPPHARMWIGRGGPAPDDPAACASLLAYASDLCMLDASLRPHGLWFGSGSASGYSLDHSIWFHAPPRVPPWMLMEQTSLGMRDGRGLGQAQLFADDGELLLTIAQLGRIREHRP